MFQVLDVGQCASDHQAIRDLIQRHFRATVDRAQSLDDALTALSAKRYDLVLVNRLLDVDGSQGMAIIKRLKSDESMKTIPVMLVSNHADAQRAAVQTGAERGFGKAGLSDPRTVETLARFLQGTEPTPSGIHGERR